MIIADIISKFIILIFVFYTLKDLIKIIKFSKSGLKEYLKNMRVGFKLMISNLIGLIILGLGRFVIERTQTLQVFGSYSFAISLTNLVFLFSVSIGMVVYPLISMFSKVELNKFYNIFNRYITLILALSLLSYFIIVFIVNHYLLNYKDIFNYLNILFVLIYIFNQKYI